jgi:hypothetical protein
MWGSIIGSALGLVGTGIGIAQASKAAKKAKGIVENQKVENQNWYDRRYNEDATQRADAQRILTRTMENIRQRNRAAAGSAAVMGGPEEAVAAAKAANNEALADTASRIAAAGEARKDSIENQYMGTKQSLDNELANIERQKAAAIAQATQSLGSSLTGAGMGVDELLNGVDPDKAPKPQKSMLTPVNYPYYGLYK